MSTWGKGPWGGSFWGGRGSYGGKPGGWGSEGLAAPQGAQPTSPWAGTGGTEFDFGQLDPQTFDYDQWLGSFYQDIASTLPTQFQFDIAPGQGQAPAATAESMGYHWDATSGTWEREQGGQTFSRSPDSMEAYLAQQNRGMPGTAMGEAMQLYEADVNRMLEAERGNFMRNLMMQMGLVGQSFEGASDLREQAMSSADILRGRAGELGGLAEDTIERVTGWIDTQMAEVDRMGEEAIQHALSAEAEYATQLASYKDASAQKMSATALGIRRSSAPITSAIATGMHPDGTPMTKQEQQASYLALNYQTSVQVQHALAPLTFEREQTLLQGSQFAAQLSGQTAGIMQQQAAIKEQAGAQFGSLLLGAEEQAANYRGLAEQLNLQAENALAAAELQATQMEVAGLFNAAQLQREFNPVSFLSGFLGLLSVPPEVWRRDFPVDMEFSFA